ncbi:probable protein S-acyltransferase 16 isoform X2 [Elaeis guineensis]|uniref:S-acyltransferase n=1 Tax=Elaeis guineensis var. tenera TaxID=51953 RepID=A0A6I9QBR5_ELAGV|nr:probable protein S-acyltransferase 16 isoform X2 [Elaeis guineensis]
MSRRGYVTLPIILVLATVAFLYYATVFVVIDEWLGLWTAAGLGNAAVFTFFTLMAVANYLIAVFGDPGRVPPSFMPDVEDADNPIHEIKRKGGDLRYCQKCSHYKPPRTHHCRVCKRCILRMVLLVGNFTRDPQKDQVQSSDSNKITYLIAGIILCPLTLALSILLVWHIYLILQNKTTIEYHEGVRAMWIAEKVGNMYRHPYNVGVYENLVSVLGPNIFCWFCPVSNYKGSGLRFRTAFENLPISTTLP